MTLPEHVQGAVLFADISGFTALTEQLAAEHGAHRGADELTVLLERVFTAVLDPLLAAGGEVISFSGDAVTCFFDHDDGLRAATCGLDMQAALRPVGVVTTASGATMQLAMKVAIAAGTARRGVVGDPAEQLIEVLAGGLLDRVAATEKLAAPGEIVIEGDTCSRLGRRVTSTPRATAAVLTGVADPTSVAPRLHPAPRVLTPMLADEQVRPWLLPAVWERLTSGRGEFLAELRPAVPIFIRFGGIDADTDPDALAALDRIVRTAQRTLADEGGNVLQLTVGDKGAYLYAVVGSPVAREQAEQHACRAALALLDLDRTTAARDLQVGVASGRLRSGTYGHPGRRTFCCLGDAVNLAARLMMAAAPGTVLVSEQVARATGDAFTWQRLAALSVKGKAEAVPLRRLLSHRTGALPSAATAVGPLLGRTEQVRQLRQYASAALAGDGRVVALVGDAGSGKTRLLGELLDELRSRGVAVHSAEATPTTAATAYSAWRRVWAALLAVDVRAPADQLAAHLTGGLDRRGRGARAPLLGALFGRTLPDTTLTAGMDAKLRKTSLEALLGDLLVEQATERPLAVALEDCQWLDPLSQDLLAAVGVRARRAPLLILVTARREGQEHIPGTATLPGDVVDLPALDTHAADELVRRTLRETFRRDDPPPAALLDALRERAEGNPLYLEQLVAYLAEQGEDPWDPAGTSALELPASMHSLVLSRLDQLSEQPRRAIKIASVIGRRFAAAALTGAYPELGSERERDDALAVLTLRALVTPEASASYVFGHPVTREVAYDSLPFALRAQLHGRVGRWLEAEHPEQVERRLDLLAHHFAHSDDDLRKREYLLRAGLAAQSAYNNLAAADYLRRVVPLLDAAERVPVLLRLGSVLELQGEWAQAEQAYADAAERADALADATGVARALVGLADVARRQGAFALAEERLSEADAVAGDDEVRARILHLQGTLASQHGDAATARARYGAALALRRQLDDRAGVAALLSNLAVVAENGGDYVEAERLGREALAVRSEVDDRWGMAVSHNNLGMVALLRSDPQAASPRFTDAVRLASEVGDPWLVGVGRHNLGNTARLLGDVGAAGREYVAALRTYTDRNDRWSVALLFEDVALLAAVADQHSDALLLVGAADGLRDELQAPRPAALQLELADALEHAMNTAPKQALRLLTEGRQRAGLAVDDAERVCRTIAKGAHLTHE